MASVMGQIGVPVLAALLKQRVVTKKRKEKVIRIYRRVQEEYGHDHRVRYGG